MTPDFLQQMARERALMMAQSDFQRGLIGREDIITQARQYEAYLSGKPVLVAEKPNSGPSEKDPFPDQCK